PRAASRARRRTRRDQQGGRRPALPQSQDDRETPHNHLRQAPRAVADRARPYLRNRARNNRCRPDTPDNVAPTGQQLTATRAIRRAPSRRGTGGVAERFAADVTDEREAADLVAEVAGRLGWVAVLVLNATGPQPEALLSEVGWNDHRVQLEYFV